MPKVNKKEPLMVTMPYPVKGASLFSGWADGRTAVYVAPKQRNNTLGCLGHILDKDESKKLTTKNPKLYKGFLYGRPHYHKMTDAPAWRSKLAVLLQELLKLKKIPEKKWNELSEACYFIPILYDNTFDIIGGSMGLESHGAFVLKSTDGFILFDPNDSAGGKFGNHFEEIITRTKDKHKLTRYYRQAHFKTRDHLNSAEGDGICNVYQMVFYLHWCACKKKGVEFFMQSIKNFDDLALPKILNHYCVYGITSIYKE